jgi:hypothetical protein
MILAIREGLPMATTALDETLQRDRTAELSPLPTPLTRGGKSEAARRSDIFERSPAAAGAARAALPTVEYARVSDELERRSREWTAMVRLLEQNRHTLDCAEMERDAAYDELARIVPIVQETAKELTAAMDASRSGRPSPDLPELFAKNSEALDQLEKVSVALSGHFLRCRAAWEQYARSVENAQRLRGEAPR